jgi:hypothetical protein
LASAASTFSAAYTLPWAIRRCSASAVMSSSSIWSAARTTASGTVSALGHAGDLLDDVVDGLQVLDVDRGDHVDAGSQQLLDVLPALLVARPGTLVWASSSTRRRAGAGEHGVEVHLGRSGAAVGIVRRGRPRALDLLRGVRAAVGLDEADHHVGAALGPSMTLAEHA